MIFAMFSLIVIIAELPPRAGDDVFRFSAGEQDTGAAPCNFQAAQIAATPGFPEAISEHNDGLKANILSPSAPRRLLRRLVSGRLRP
ncbi:MAG: hypothetical protein KIS81_09955 [Maricaulaceae bacterium]|nr:hypothetical protein [Maricaulaceae bacterium]